jgi:hypothetical protein
MMVCHLLDRRRLSARANSARRTSSRRRPEYGSPLIRLRSVAPQHSLDRYCPRAVSSPRAVPSEQLGRRDEEGAFSASRRFRFPSALPCLSHPIGRRCPAPCHRVAGTGRTRLSPCVVRSGTSLPAFRSSCRDRSTRLAYPAPPPSCPRCAAPHRVIGDWCSRAASDHRRNGRRRGACRRRPRCGMPRGVRPPSRVQGNGGRRPRPTPTRRRCPW